VIPELMRAMLAAAATLPMLVREDGDGFTPATPDATITVRFDTGHGVGAAIDVEWTPEGFPTRRLAATWPPGHQWYADSLLVTVDGERDPRVAWSAPPAA